MPVMPEEPTDKQLAFLRRLKYEGPPPKTKREASVLIDASKAKQAKAKESGKAFNGLTPSQAKKALEKEHRAWLKERRKEIREQVRDDLADQREFERDMRKHGGLDRRDECAGWLLRIGEDCTESQHLDGLLVTAEAAKADPDLLPPYETCREETCGCEIEPVSVRDVPKGTRIAEREPEAGSTPSHRPSKSSSSNSPDTSKSGCMTMLLGLMVIVLSYLAAA